jgi:DNA repair exonuclease SbcCD ATPase subunit
MITKLTTRNFIGVADGTHDFGTINRITGRNGGGKTSLGRAMLFALTGLSPQLTAAGADYIADSALTMQIDLETSIGTIACKRNKTSRSVTIDKLPVTDTVLEQRFGMPLFALGCMFWPESFFQLPTQKRRDLFMAITPAQHLPSIFAAITENIDPKIVDWAMPAKALQTGWATKRLALERDVAKAQGQLEEAKRNQITDIKDVKLVHGNLANLQMQLNELTKRQNAFADQAQKVARYDLDLHAWEEIKAKNLAALKQNGWVKHQSEKLIDTTELTATKKRCEELATDAKANLDQIRTNGKIAADKLKEAQLVPELCDKCGQKWPHAKADTSKAELEVEELHKKFDAQLQLQKEILANYKEISAELADKEKQNKELGDLTIADVPIIPEKPEQVACLNRAEMDGIRTEIAETMQDIAEQKAMLTRIVADTEIAEAQKQRVTALTKELNALTAELLVTKKVEAALNPKTGVWAIALKQKLAVVCLPGFDFKFTETQANGEERDTFIVVRKEDGCQIESMSSGEKIKFCLALSSLIAQLTESKFKSVFLEHTDLLDAVPAPRGFQVFAERVTKEDLKIEVVK